MSTQHSYRSTFSVGRREHDDEFRQNYTIILELVQATHTPTMTNRPKTHENVLHVPVFLHLN